MADVMLDTSVQTPDQLAAALVLRLPTTTRQTTLSTIMSAPLSEQPQHVDVDGAAPYRIHIGPGLLDDGALLTATLRGRHALIVSDANVAPLYAKRVEAALREARPELKIARHVIDAGESEKTLANFAGAIDALAALGATRDACVYALGGGVIGDMAGFAAACWMRGIDVVQLPTTLLAMVDSSVGGKTAVDIPQGKNLVGAFHPPRAVIADTTSLRSLPARELRAGLAEVIKYGAIVDADFLHWLDRQRDALLAGDDAALSAAIARSCAHKATITQRDPFEHGERALLNFGHTFGHAIEAEQGYAHGFNHGEAVAVGMVLAARLSTALGMASEDAANHLQTLLQHAGLPVRLPTGLAAEALLARMRLDKKAQASGLRFILWKGPGQAVIAADVDEAAVLGVLRNG
jgi:3-dehydroquinate synthase